MTGSGTQGERFRIEHALLVSILLVALLALINPILSFASEITEPEPEETVLQFDLAQPAPLPEPFPEPEPLPEEPAEPAPPVEELAAAEPDLEPPTNTMDAPPLGSPITGEDDEYATPEPGLDDVAETTEAEPTQPTPLVEEQVPEVVEPAVEGVNALGEGPDPLAEIDPEDDPADELQLEPDPSGETGVDELLQDPQEGTDPESPLSDLEEGPPSDPQLPPQEREPEAPAGSLQFDDESYVRDQGFQFGIKWESKDFDFNDYVHTMLVHLNQVFQRRQYLARGQLERWAYQRRDWHVFTEVITVQFTIQRNGQMTAHALTTLSGMEPLDNSVRDTLLEAVFAPLPPGFPRQEETFTLYVPPGDVDIRAWIRTLEYYKRRGLF
jgi:hypothetical protein